MGHDITSYTKKSHLRRNAFSADIHKFYKHLDKEDCDGRVSGNGSDVLIYNEDAMKAVEAIKNDKSINEENKIEFTEFLVQAVNDSPDGNFMISFS